MLENRPNRWRAMHLYHPLCSRRISVKFKKPSGVCWTGGLESSFCQTGRAFGFASTSHFRDTGIPSRIGKPKPGSLDIANEGVSEMKKRQWYSLAKDASSEVYPVMNSRSNNWLRRPEIFKDPLDRRINRTSCKSLAVMDYGLPSNRSLPITNVLLKKFNDRLPRQSRSLYASSIRYKFKFSLLTTSTNDNFIQPFMVRRNMVEVEDRKDRIKDETKTNIS